MDEKSYNVQGKVLHLRDKATFWQVRNTAAIISNLEIDEKSNVVEIINKIGDGLTEFMQTIFDRDTDGLAFVEWNDVEFDLVVEIITDFLSSSVQLKRVLNGLTMIFQNLGTGTLPGGMNPGPGATTGNASSTAPPAETGAKRSA